MSPSFTTIHFIGISGSGVSAAAKMALELGKTVSGSDIDYYPVIEKLQAKGASIIIGPHRAENLPEGVDLVVASNAVFDLNPDNGEFAEATRRGIPILHYPEYLGMLMEGKKGIAVAGTHGKSTTTSMLVTTLKKADVDTSFVIGAEVPELGGNSGIGKDDHFVVEACEYQGSFFNYHPETIVITNLDADHLDYYKTFENILIAFEKFVRTLPKNGCLIICGDDQGNKQLLQRLQSTPFKIITYGKEETNDLIVRNISYDHGLPHAEISSSITDAPSSGMLKLNVHGEHNVYNALAVVAVCQFYGIELHKALAAVSQFHGLKRRMELIGVKNGIKVYDDYGHHPAEVQVTLRAMRQKEQDTFATGGRMICVYQPHLYSRTMMLIDEIQHSFDDADIVVVPKICGAREKDTGVINSQMVVDRINQHYGKEKAVLTPEFQDIVDWLHANAKAGDVVMTTSCGDIWKAAKMYVEQ